MPCTRRTPRSSTAQAPLQRITDHNIPAHDQTGNAVLLSRRARKSPSDMRRQRHKSPQRKSYECVRAERAGRTGCGPSPVLVMLSYVGQRLCQDIVAACQECLVRVVEMWRVVGIAARLRLVRIFGYMGSERDHRMRLAEVMALRLL